MTRPLLDAVPCHTGCAPSRTGVAHPVCVRGTASPERGVPPSGPGATLARGRRGNGRRRRCGPEDVRAPGASRVPPRPPSPTLGFARAGGTPIAPAARLPAGWVGRADSGPLGCGRPQATGPGCLFRGRGELRDQPVTGRRRRVSADGLPSPARLPAGGGGGARPAGNGATRHGPPAGRSGWAPIRCTSCCTRRRGRSVWRPAGCWKGWACGGRCGSCAGPRRRRHEW